MNIIISIARVFPAKAFSKILMNITCMSTFFNILIHLIINGIILIIWGDFSQNPYLPYQHMLWNESIMISSWCIFVYTEMFLERKYTWGNTIEMDIKKFFRRIMMLTPEKQTEVFEHGRQHAFRFLCGYKSEDKRYEGKDLFESEFQPVIDIFDKGYEAGENEYWDWMRKVSTRKKIPKVHPELNKKWGIKNGRLEIKQ